MILLTPGPCMTSETVRLAGAMPDMNHREPAFQELFRDTQRRLLSIYAGMEQASADAEPWQACLIGGGGTAAVEAMIHSCTGEGKCLVLTNGYYSGRQVEILKALNKPLGIIDADWLEPLDLQWIEKELASGQYDTLLFVHNETTTGRLNDLAAIGSLCRAHDVTCLVDAMSSFGVQDIDVSLVDAIASSSNKCLHGTPGVSFVLASDRLLPRITKKAPGTYYLDLSRYISGQMSFTPAVPAIAALRQALIEHPGQPARLDDYKSKASFIRTALAERGFRPVIPVDESSAALTTYYAPKGWTAPEWIAANRERGYLLYGCKEHLAPICFQVANMGDLSVQQLRDWITAVDTLLKAA